MFKFGCVHQRSLNRLPLKCTAGFIVRFSTVRIVSSTVTCIAVPPNVSVQPNEVTVVKGEHVRLTCTATGVPLPVVSWYSPIRELVLRNHTLVIDNVSRNDHGEYFCEAKNEAGKKIVKTRITVSGIL